MYRGFDLKLDNIKNDVYHSIGIGVKENGKKIIRQKLVDFLSPDGSLSGTEIMENWFPTVDADVFLSHSHKDEKLALTVAGLLKEKLNLNVFIDSIVWGYSERLLKNIDDKYCRNDGEKTYSYDKRNYTTSHVNLMLSNALNKMIDNCECIIFLNSPPLARAQCH